MRFTTKLLPFFNNPGIFQFSRYIFVGLINFLFSYLLFYTIYELFHVQYILAFTITWLFGIILTYIINLLWVFKPDEKIGFKKRFLKYFAVYLVSYCVNIILLKVIVETYQFHPMIIQLGIIPLVMAINFMGFKFWSLK